MIRKMTVLVIALAAVSTTGCKKKDAASGGAADKAAPDDKAAAGGAGAAPAGAKLVFKKLGDQPVEAEVPDDANIEDSTKTAGFTSVTVYASPTVFFGAGEDPDLKPTIEETKAQLGKDPMNKLKAFSREEKTADGWILEGTRESGVEPGKELYLVAVRKTIGGAPWNCGTNAQTKDELAKAEKICLSLRAAGGAAAPAGGAAAPAPGAAPAGAPAPSNAVKG